MASPASAIPPEAIRGPGDELVARGIGAIDDRGPRPIEQRLIGTAVVQLETEELPVVSGRLHVAELFDEPDRIEGLGRLGISGIGAHEEVAEECQRLGLGRDACRAPETVDRVGGPPVERIDAGEPDERSEIVIADAERVGECRPGRRAVAGESRIFADRVVVEADVLDLVLDGRGSSGDRELERLRGIAGDGGEARLPDRRRPNPPTASRVVRSARAASMRPSSSSASKRTANAAGSDGASRQQGIGRRDRGPEVVQRHEGRRFDQSRRHVAGLDGERRPCGREGSLVVGQVVAQSATALVEDGEVGRREEVTWIGLEVLRPRVDGVIDLAE